MRSTVLRRNLPDILLSFVFLFSAYSSVIHFQPKSAVPLICLPHKSSWCVPPSRSDVRLYMWQWWCSEEFRPVQRNEVVGEHQPFFEACRNDMVSLVDQCDATSLNWFSSLVILSRNAYMWSYISCALLPGTSKLYVKTTLLSTTGTAPARYFASSAFATAFSQPFSLLFFSLAFCSSWGLPYVLSHW